MGSDSIPGTLTKYTDSIIGLRAKMGFLGVCFGARESLDLDGTSSICLDPSLAFWLLSST